MSKKTKKLTGKEQAKLNKRKKFYGKLERLYNRAVDTEKKMIFLSMNKRFSFPEFDALSLVLTKNFVEMDDNINMEDFSSLELVFFEDVQFLFESSKSNLIKICRRETKLNNDGELRKGVDSSKEDYDYQVAYNWAIQIEKNDKFAKVLAKEKINPSEYDLTPPPAVIGIPFFYKSKKPPRRRRR